MVVSVWVDTANVALRWRHAAMLCCATVFLPAGEKHVRITGRRRRVGRILRGRFSVYRSRDVSMTEMWRNQTEGSQSPLAICAMHVKGHMGHGKHFKQALMESNLTVSGWRRNNKRHSITHLIYLWTQHCGWIVHEQQKHNQCLINFLKCACRPQAHTHIHQGQCQVGINRALVGVLFSRTWNNSSTSLTICPSVCPSLPETLFLSSEFRFMFSL